MTPKTPFQNWLTKGSLGSSPTSGLEHWDLIIGPTEMLQQPDLPAEIAEAANVGSGPRWDPPGVPALQTRCKGGGQMWFSAFRYSQAVHPARWSGALKAMYTIHYTCNSVFPTQTTRCLHCAFTLALWFSWNVFHILLHLADSYSCITHHLLSFPLILFPSSSH